MYRCGAEKTQSEKDYRLKIEDFRLEDPDSTFNLKRCNLEFCVLQSEIVNPQSGIPAFLASPRRPAVT
jgi:hypothetical protein